jgi:hypothetical protein
MFSAAQLEESERLKENGTKAYKEKSLTTLELEVAVLFSR